MIVQSKGFKHTNIVGNAYTAVDFFNTWAVDEIILLDVSREPTDRKKFYKTIQNLSKRCFVPLTVGGWIKSVDEIRLLLKKGADKVSINTEAVRRPEFIEEAAHIFGSQCIVISIDTKKKENGEYKVFIDRGQEPTDLSPFDWAKEVEKHGAGEIFLTSIDRDGSMKGYDLELIRKVSESVTIPVIASGGVGNWQHLVEGIKIGKADAVSAANIFHFIEQSTKKAKEYMKNAGINVRVPAFHKVGMPRSIKYEI
jgi:cyclase